MPRSVLRTLVRSTVAVTALTVSATVLTPAQADDGRSAPPPEPPALRLADVAPTPAATPGSAYGDPPTYKPDAEGADIRARIRALPGVTGLYEVKTGEPGWRFFVVRMSQLIDHAHPEAGRFETRITVTHRATSAPTTVSTYRSAYTKPGWYEPTLVIGGNQIVVETRFSGTSRPKVEPADLPTALTMPQIAGDTHTVIATFKRLYTGRWISFGGTASAFSTAYRPGDVVGSVLYEIADLTPGRPRAVGPFYERVGTATCRARIRAVQRYVLEHRTAFLRRVDQTADRLDLTYDTPGGSEVAMEWVVTDLPSYIWQGSGAECASIPANLTLDRVWNWSKQRLPLWAYHDEYLASIVPIAYLQANQVGELAPYEKPFAALLEHPGTNLLKNWIPAEYAQQVSPAPSQRLRTWADRQARRTLFLRGAMDPFTVGGADCGTNGAPRQCVLQVVQGRGDGVALLDVPRPRRLELASMIRRWAGVA